MQASEVSHATVLEKTAIAAKVTRYVVSAPEIARRYQPGQFVIVRLRQSGERIPLTIADADLGQGTITLVVQEVGRTTTQMADTLRVGDRLLDLLGPLGVPSHIEKIGRVLAVGGGVGIAALHPICKGLLAAGNEVVGILGARSQDLLIMQEEMRQTCSRLRLFTDDGSSNERGLVTDGVRSELSSPEKYQLCIAIGPLPMMRAVSEVTRQFNVATKVSLNTIMVDGTGMCGGCRATVNNSTKFVCVDGPEFDGHQVDYDELSRRQNFYRSQEKASLEAYLQERQVR